MVPEKAYYDTETVTLTPSVLGALLAFGRAFLDMMRRHEPELADCWTWIDIEIRDLAAVNPIDWQAGGEEDRLEGFAIGDVRIRSRADAARPGGQEGGGGG